MRIRVTFNIWFAVNGNGKSYYNTWIRYGSTAIFGEVNYLGIRDTIDGDSVYARSVGFSVGFPIARFF